MGLATRVAILAALALAALCLCSAALATFPGENEKIAFSRDGDIWIMDPNESNQEQITSGPAEDLGRSGRRTDRRSPFGAIRKIATECSSMTS